jgi:hypothetical protein
MLAVGKKYTVPHPTSPVGRTTFKLHPSVESFFKSPTNRHRTHAQTLGQYALMAVFSVEDYAGAYRTKERVITRGFSQQS